MLNNLIKNPGLVEGRKKQQLFGLLESIDIQYNRKLKELFIQGNEENKDG